MSRLEAQGIELQAQNFGGGCENDLSGKLYAARVGESSENNEYMMVQEPPSLQEQHEGQLENNPSRVAQLIASEAFSSLSLIMTRSRRAKQPSMKGTEKATRVHLVTLPMSFPSCLLAGPHAIACDLPSFLAARNRVRSCSHSPSAKSPLMSGCASQKSRQPLAFTRLSRAWWASLNRCRKSVLQLRHVDVSPIFRGRLHRRFSRVGPSSFQR